MFARINHLFFSARSRNFGTANNSVNELFRKAGYPAAFQFGMTANLILESDPIQRDAITPLFDHPDVWKKLTNNKTTPKELLSENAQTVKKYVEYSLSQNGEVNVSLNEFSVLTEQKRAELLNGKAKDKHEEYLKFVN